MNNSIQILKFGGTSLGNAGRILGILEIISSRMKKTNVGIVLSAVSGITNLLVTSVDKAVQGESYQDLLDEYVKIHRDIIDDLSKTYPNLPHQALQSFIATICQQVTQLLQGVQLIKECPPKSYCKILSFGEVASARIVFELLRSAKVEVTFLNAQDYIKTKGELIEGTPIMDELITRFGAVKNKPCLLMSGFIASDLEGNLSLLGRNGSDYSASLMAVGTHAERCEIWTDVDGIYTADPNQVPDAKLISRMSYGEAMELAFYGAKVLHPKTTAVLVSARIPLYIKNSFNPMREGTKISEMVTKEPESLIRAVSCMKDIALINIYGAGMKGVPGIAARIFDAVAKCGVSVVLISQASSEYSICFCVMENDATLVYKILNEALFLELQAKIIENIEIMHHQAIICIVGDEMRTRYGIAGKFFSSLAQTCINIVAIAQGSSERCISAVINGSDSHKAVHAVHRTFFHSLQPIELYIIGIGSVGSELIAQIKLQQQTLFQNNVDLKVCALANSTHALHSEEGIDLSHWRETMQNNAGGLASILEKAKLDKPLNGILLDCTNSDEIVKSYIDAFKAGLHVVTASKKANSGAYTYYQAIRQAADKHKRLFLYETNVGAGLPIIDNFKALIKSGDKLIAFSGILSGSLSYIFGALEEGIPFSTAVSTAVKNKFTEPDPRDDLSGLDVARKLLILARELGLQYELEHINIEPIFPPDFDSSGRVPEFLEKLKNIDHYFADKIATLRAQGKVLRLVGEIKEEQCSVGIREVSTDDPLYAIKNGENAFSFLTKRYSPIPLVVRGYGAGVSVTASGLFADILKTVNIN